MESKMSKVQSLPDLLGMLDETMPVPEYASAVQEQQEETPHIVDHNGRSPKRVVVHKDRKRRQRRRRVRGRNKGGGGGGGAPWTNVYCVARDDGEYAYDAQVCEGSRVVLSKTIRANSWGEAKDKLLDELVPGQHATLDQEHIGGKPVVRRRRAQYAGKKQQKKKPKARKAKAEPVTVAEDTRAARARGCPRLLDLLGDFTTGDYNGR
jgi:hypothetical protein